MLLLRAEELENQGISCQGGSEFVFHNTIFKKGKSFPNSNRQEAIESCNRYLKANIVCLVVETQGKLTLWAANSELNQPEEPVCERVGNAGRYENTLGEKLAPARENSIPSSNFNPPQKPTQQRSHKFAANQKTSKPVTP